MSPIVAVFGSGRPRRNAAITLRQSLTPRHPTGLTDSFTEPSWHGLFSISSAGSGSKTRTQLCCSMISSQTTGVVVTIMTLRRKPLQKK